jgi:CheY-like chemotaxis protein
MDGSNELKDVCKGMKVLVVDDLRPNLALIKAYFETLGCEGDYAKNGLEAVEKVRHNKYDICLMDFQMPLMGGIEATKIIRQELKSDMVIIALTGSATIEDLREGLACGMNSFCTKPISMQDLAIAMLVYRNPQ